jgi:hypothetical protein
MKSLLIALALLPAFLAADGVSPTARPAPAPAPAPFDAATAAHAGFYVPFWSAALHLTGAMPLGEMSTFNSLGFGAQLDAIYHPAQGVLVDLFAVTASLPAVQPPSTNGTVYLGTSIPMSLLGAGLKGGYVIYAADQMSLSVDAGMGYGSVQRTAHASINGNHWPVKWQLSQGPQESGLILTGGIQVTYLIVTDLNLIMALDYMAVELGGGTSDTPQLGLPSIGLQYDFD